MDWLQKWIQKILAFLLMKPFFSTFFKLKKSGFENIESLKGPLLIIANHKFCLDHFAFGAALPLSSKIFPIRFLGALRFNHKNLEFLRKIGIIKLIYGVFSVIPVVRGQSLDIALQIPFEILKNDGTIFIYPEGRVNKNDILDQFKRGAPYLSLKTNTKVLPVAFKISGNGWRKDYQVKCGQIFTLPENLTPEEGADYMRNTVSLLYGSLS